MDFVGNIKIELEDDFGNGEPTQDNDIKVGDTLHKKELMKTPSDNEKHSFYEIKIELNEDLEYSNEEKISKYDDVTNVIHSQHGGESMADSSEFKKQTNTSEERRELICNVCGKSFTQKSCLKRHLNSHAEVKPFKCEICSKSFAQKYNLKQHIDTH